MSARADILGVIGRVTDKSTLEFAKTALAKCDEFLKETSGIPDEQ